MSRNTIISIPYKLKNNEFVIAVIPGFLTFIPGFPNC